MPAQFENGRKFDDKNSLQDLMPKNSSYLHSKNRPVSIQKCRKCSVFIFVECLNDDVSNLCRVTVPFSKSTVFKICRQKMCRFHVNGRPIRRIFHRFQNVPASCERSLI